MHITLANYPVSRSSNLPQFSDNQNQCFINANKNKYSKKYITLDLMQHAMYKVSTFSKKKKMQSNRSTIFAPKM